MPRLKIFYLVHDVCDPAVHRRLAMLRDGGAIVTLGGFRRRRDAVADTIDFGQTHNGRFLHRAFAVIGAIATLARHKKRFFECDLILCRTLEMLAIGVAARHLCGPKPALVYECLDIHRLMLNRGPIGYSLRGLEGWLSRRASALITSSPAFVKFYFESLSRVRLPIRMVENKVYAVAAPQQLPRPAGPPWRIGWFGVIRCAYSLRLLDDLVRRSAGRVAVVIRGRPAYDQFVDFDHSVTQNPGLHFLGPYTTDDLATIYRDVHFTWAIDRFEAGQNSSWLLPNRLYEGGLYGSVPIAEGAVETGRFLEQRGIGVVLADPIEKSLADFFAALTHDQYRKLETASAAIDPHLWVYDQSDSEGLVSFLKNCSTK